MGGGSTKARKSWLREVAAAEDALDIRLLVVQLEEAVYGEYRAQFRRIWEVSACPLLFADASSLSCHGEMT